MNEAVLAIDRVIQALAAVKESLTGERVRLESVESVRPSATGNGVLCTVNFYVSDSEGSGADCSNIDRKPL